MISSKIGHSCDHLVLGVYRFLFRGRVVNPNLLSVFGAGCAFIAFIAISFDRLVLGGVALLVSAAFDLMDGALARNTGQVTAFGGFLDSVLDRYSDLLVMCGIFIHFMNRGVHFDQVMTFIASIGIAVIPYARARAEAARLACNTGLLERPERLLILLCGLFSGYLGYAVILLAVFTHVTVIQRVVHTKRVTDQGTDR